MSKKRMVLFGFSVVVFAGCYLGWKLTARGAYESAEYSVVESDGAIELREYPDLMLVTTGMRFESQGNDGSFMRLFRYISGANRNDRKVAMTTPVFMERESSDADGRMGFVVPKQVTQEGVPEPSNKEVRIHKRAGGRFAVIRFAGRINQELITKEERKLREWIDRKGLVGVGEAEIAGYDPPWTPGPLRRNELLIRLRMQTPDPVNERGPSEAVAKPDGSEN